MTLPHDKIIVYDGQCGLCSKSVQWVLRHDRQGLFKFAAIQSELGQSICREAELDPANPSTMILAIGDLRLVRSSGALEIACHLDFPWRSLAVLRVVPVPLRDWIYQWVANHRHWLGGTTCMLPKPEWRDRFLG